MWEAQGVGFGMTSPVPFVQMPITYDRAFGGTDTIHEDPSKHAAFMENPSGKGFHSQIVKEWIHGTPLPNTEEIGRPVTWMNGDYKPMSFGPIGRNWAARAAYAGTYDAVWLSDHFPFLPSDFDDRYHQAAPFDQQLPMPLGEQQVRLVNLTPDGDRTFVLPHMEAPIQVLSKKGLREDFRAFADTVVVEPDEERVTMTWRVARPLRKNIFELAQVLIGRNGTDERPVRNADAVA